MYFQVVLKLGIEVVVYPKACPFVLRCLQASVGILHLRLQGLEALKVASHENISMTPCNNLISGKRQERQPSLFAPKE